MGQTINVLGQSITLPDEYAYGDLLKQVDYVASGLGWSKEQAKQAIIAGAHGQDPNNFTWWGPEAVKEVALRGAGIDPAPYINPALKAQQQQQQAEYATSISPEAADRASGGGFGGLIKELVTGPVGQFAGAAAAMYGGVNGLGNLASSFGYNAGGAAGGDVAALGQGQVAAMNPGAGGAQTMSDYTIPTIEATDYAGVLPGVEFGANPAALGTAAAGTAALGAGGAGAAGTTAAGGALSSLPSWVTSALGSAAGPIAGSVISGLMSSSAASQQANAANRAADLNASATDRAIALQQQQLAQQQGIYDTNRADLAPWRAAGTNALAQINPGLQPGGQFAAAKPFSFDASQMATEPGYAFGLSEGLKQLERQAAANGTLLSGAQLKGISRYTQDYAQTKFQDAFNRAKDTYGTNQGNTTNAFSRLATTAGLGQNANSQGIVSGQNYGSAGQNYANNAGNLGINSAGVYGDAGLAAANASTNGYAGIGNSINRLLTSPQATNALSGLFNQSSYSGGGRYPGDVATPYQPNNGGGW